MKIKTKDKIVQEVINKIDQRSLVGQAKYGATMMEEIQGEVKDLDRFLVDVQEEIMDALLYIQAARHYLRDEIKAKYEGETFVLLSGFHFENSVYERCSNGKGDYKDRGSKRILPIKYTPDFIGDDFIIETKGRANESFPMRWKLFKRLVMNQFPNYTLYKPQNQKECDETIRLILNLRNK